MMSSIAVRDNFDSNLRICQRRKIDSTRLKSAKWTESKRQDCFSRDKVAAAAIVENSIIRAWCRRGTNLNSIYRRISRLAAEIRSTRSRNEGSRLAVDRERWTGAASIIQRLHRNFVHRMPNRDAHRFQRERECIEKHLANMRTHILSTCVTVAE